MTLALCSQVSGFSWAKSESAPFGSVLPRVQIWGNLFVPRKASEASPRKSPTPVLATSFSLLSFYEALHAVFSRFVSCFQGCESESINTRSHFLQYSDFGAVNEVFPWTVAVPLVKLVSRGCGIPYKNCVLRFSMVWLVTFAESAIFALKYPGRCVKSVFVWRRVALWEKTHDETSVTNC